MGQHCPLPALSNRGFFQRDCGVSGSAMTPNSSSYSCWDCELQGALFYWPSSCGWKQPREAVWRFRVGADLTITIHSHCRCCQKAPYRSPCWGRERRQTATHSPFPSLQQGEKQGPGQGMPNLETKKGWRNSWSQAPHTCCLNCSLKQHVGLGLVTKPTWLLEL